MVSVKPLWIYEAIFMLVTAGNMSVYQHVLERKRVLGRSSTDSFAHTHRSPCFVFLVTLTCGSVPKAKFRPIKHTEC